MGSLLGVNVLVGEVPNHTVEDAVPFLLPSSSLFLVDHEVRVLPGHNVDHHSQVGRDVVFSALVQSFGDKEFVENLEDVVLLLDRPGFLLVLGLALAGGTVFGGRLGFLAAHCLLLFNII